MQLWHKELTRVVTPSIIVSVIFLLFITSVYTMLPPALQLTSLKALLCSSGFLTAHILGKLAFPTVKWDGMSSPAHYVRIALYVICIYSFALGG